MLKRTERIKSSSPEHHGRLFAATTESIDEMLEKLGVKKVKSHPATPELNPRKTIEQPAIMRL